MLNRVGLRPPGVQVRFQDLTVYANIHVGSRATPTVLNSYRNAVEVSLRLLPRGNVIGPIACALYGLSQIVHGRERMSCKF